MADISFIKELVANPRESLTVELKAWFDPTTPAGQSKLVRFALAMRNHGGGFMLIGFDNQTSQPVTDNRPHDVRAVFHTDTIQGLITRFSSEAFEISIHFVERGGAEFPVIEVPQGIKTPVATKSSLTDAGVELVKTNRVYVRSLKANNVPSTTEAIWSDWVQLSQTCFENREADIGRFLRRHLSGLTTANIRAVAEALQETIAPEASVESNLIRLLDYGFHRFHEVRKEKNARVPDHGSWEVAAVIVGTLPPHQLNQDFLNLLLANNPDFTGWPTWTDSRNFRDPGHRPYVAHKAWEAFIWTTTPGWNHHFDFWRLAPAGEFYLYRALDDDLSDVSGKPKPLTVLDFTLPVIRVAEAITSVMAFARALGCQSESSSLSFAFRWTGLAGRILTSWADRRRLSLSSEARAYQNEVTSNVVVKLDAPLTALGSFVDAATEPLFALFDGFDLPTSVIEDLTRQLIERRR